jgi:Lipopolysaccharide kinase (Kdo/WaaP) family
MNQASLWARLVRGTRWTWFSEIYRSALPADLDDTVMTLQIDDRHHVKQGRSTGRIRFHSGSETLSVYLKRHYRLPLASRILALVDPAGRHSPAAAEWAHLERARAIGISVPNTVAAGEWIGPWGNLKSFLMVAELTGSQAVNEALPRLATELEPSGFAALKHQLAAEMAEITARLHRSSLFHKDLYLCHFYLDTPCETQPRLHLIDLHRLGEHRWTAPWWRWKDLGQLLYSTYSVDEIDDADRMHFWNQYRGRVQLRWPSFQLWMVQLKASLYRSHNR